MVTTKKPPLFHHIGWDWNGTLCNDAQIFIVDGFIPALQAHGLPVPEYESLRHDYSIMGPERMVEELTRRAGRKAGSVTWDGHIRPHLAESLAGVEYRMAWGALKALEHFHDLGLEMCLISGLNEEGLVAELDRRKLWKYFKFVRGDVRDKRLPMERFVRDMRCQRAPRRVMYVSDMAMDLAQVYFTSYTVAYTGGYGSIESLAQLRVQDPRTGEWKLVKPHATINRWDQLEGLGNFVRRQW